MTIHVLPVGMLQANCYIVGDPQSKVCAIIDPGAKTEKILDEVNRLGYSVSHILLTHGHFDHVMSAPAIQAQTGAKLCIHPLDEPFLGEPAAKHKGYVKEDYVTPTVDIYLSDGMTLDIGALKCTVMHTPGHSMGSCIFIVEDGIFSGDTLFYRNCGRCDLEGGSYEQMLKSLARIARIEGEYKIFPGHERASLLSEERAANPYMREGLLK